MIFRHTLQTWRNTWCIGIFLTVLSILFNKHLFYINYYFYLVGLVSLANYLYKYIRLDNNGLTVNYNLLSNIFIGWSDIKSAIKTTYEKSNIKTAGGRVRFTINQKEDSEAILLDFHKPLNKEFKNRNIQIVDNGYRLLLIAPPEDGFGNLLFSINAYLNKEAGKLIHSQNKKKSTYINIIILTVSLIFICLNFNKFVLS